MKQLHFNQKVFGIGLSRTATSSLAAALNQLGIRTKHHPYDEVTERELLSGSGHLTILKRYQGLVDRIAWHYSQLDEAFPDSKFILTIREKMAWLQSMRKLKLHIQGLSEFDKEHYIDRFEQHMQGVLNYFKDRPSDLLVMDIPGGDGWEKLCSFLGQPMPEAPFPHENDWQAFFKKHAPNIAEWRKRVAAVRSDIQMIIPPNHNFILVDDCELAADNLGGLPFLEHNGTYWGRPRDDATAISELERMRQNGADFFTIAWPAFWWLDHYTELNHYLRERYRCVLQNARLIVFDLTSMNRRFSVG